MRAGVEITEAVDGDWLRSEFAERPLAHAYALWDLTTCPEKVSFVSCRTGGKTIAYLLTWWGDPLRATVHWAGDDPRADLLAAYWPSGALRAILPEAVAGRLAPRLRGGKGERILGQMGSPSERPGDPLVRPLRAVDYEALRSWAAERDDPFLRSYRSARPDGPLVWGAWRAGRLVGVARAEVRLPSLWVLGGIFVDERWRRQGIGRALTAAGAHWAAAAGAACGLWVRASNRPARALYRSLGFVTVESRYFWEGPGPGPVSAGGPGGA